MDKRKVRFLSSAGNDSLQEYQDAIEDLHRMSFSVRVHEPETGFWVVIRPHLYQARRHPFLELVCDMDDVPKVRDWIAQTEVR